MKTLYTVIPALILTIVFARTASAQTPPPSSSGATLPEVRVALPPDLAQCVQACTAASASPRPAEHSECSGVTDSALRGRIETMATEIARLRREVTAHGATLANHERRLRELERQVGLLSSRTDDLERSVRELRGMIAQDREAIAGLQRQYEQLQRDYSALSVRVESLEGSFRTLSTTVSGFDGRISSLESRMASARVGVGAGFLVLHSLDGTTYTGAPLTARLTLQFTPTTTLSVSGGPLLSVSSAPIGAFGRVGLGFDLSANWSIETGVSTAWVGYNDRLRASSMFLMADVGPAFRYKWFSVSASPLLGAEFDQGSPAFAFGGLLNLRGEWP